MSGTWVNPSTPNLTDFTTFVQNGMGISATYLPTSSDYLQWSLNIATAETLTDDCIPPPIYVLAVYNCGGHHLITMAQDQPGLTYFQDARLRFGINSFVAGVVQSSSDQGTSNALVVPESFQALTISDLEYLRTPWGRAYLGYAQKFGPTVVVGV